VYSPSRSCLNVPADVMNTFLNKLVVNTFKEFMPNGGLRPMLEACVASLLRYDRNVISDTNSVNAITVVLREAYTATYKCSTDIAIGSMREWGKLIRSDLEKNNPDFHPLTNTSNSVQVVATLNNIGTSVAQLQWANLELRKDIANLITVTESERIESESERTEKASLCRDIVLLIKAKKSERIENSSLRRDMALLMKADGKLMESNKAILRHTWKVGNHLGFHPPPSSLHKRIHSEESLSPRQHVHSEFSESNLMLDEEHV
jgi:hypothetical protein